MISDTNSDSKLKTDLCDDLISYVLFRQLQDGLTGTAQLLVNLSISPSYDTQLVEL
jgi:hypothetical protein